ncbi:hypothetical protein [Sphingobium sp. B11D3D]|uniref:hypothetical protein n=1 Tax=Sphingobium sp. B11D3D TaxID=2940576 RepID=UPI00222448E5|nr:hypothetical protein [Sphingobium sp. B11D3D]
MSALAVQIGLRAFTDKAKSSLRRRNQPFFDVARQESYAPLAMSQYARRQVFAWRSARGSHAGGVVRWIAQNRGHVPTTRGAIIRHQVKFRNIVAYVQKFTPVIDRYLDHPAKSVALP